MIFNVFENDKRYIVDFEECLNLILNLMKGNFKSCLKINSLITGDSVYHKTPQEIEDIIIKTKQDFIEVLNNV